MDSYIWIVMFAGTFYLSLKASRPLAPSLQRAWLGLAISVCSPAINAVFDWFINFFEIRVSLPHDVWFSLQTVISGVALAVTALSLGKYFREPKG
jgi:hypothetical protein